jgi:hypothetical protein
MNPRQIFGKDGFFAQIWARFTPIIWMKLKPKTSKFGEGSPPQQFGEDSSSPFKW